MITKLFYDTASRFHANLRLKIVVQTQDTEERIETLVTRNKLFSFLHTIDI